MKSLEFRSMNCQMLAVLDSAHAQSVEWLAEVPLWFADWEQRLSRFRIDSELRQLNRNRGRAFPVSSVLWDVVQTALRAAATSGGLVTPTLLTAMESAGYDRSFSSLQLSGQPSGASIYLKTKTPMAVKDWQAIECSAQTRSIRLPLGVQLDLGGIAKGWAAQQAVQKLSQHGPALVDAGGDIAISGPRADGTAWPIGVTDPDGHEVEMLMLSGGGVATSGRDYRRWQQGDRWQHHILDPRTGQPAQTDVLTVTIIAPTACEAEMAAKVVLILGSQAGLQWLEAHPSFAGLLILEEGRILRSRRFKSYVWS
jgi:thiamine biosynthesis lipoprotein